MINSLLSRIVVQVVKLLPERNSVVSGKEVKNRKVLGCCLKVDRNKDEVNIVRQIVNV